MPLEHALALVEQQLEQVSGHLLANDVRNKWGYTTGFLHRSTDGARTWQSTRIESEQVKPGASNHATRNVLQLDDGTLLLGAGAWPFVIGLWRDRRLVDGAVSLAVLALYGYGSYITFWHPEVTSHPYFQVQSLIISVHTLDRLAPAVLSRPAPVPGL